MATPGELIVAVSKCFGIPETTVFQHDRELVKAGFRRASGRGRHASVTPIDAANLLITIMASPPFGPAIKESAVTLKKYHRLNAWTPGPFLTPGAWKHALPKLPAGHSLRDAVAEIISSFACGRFDSAINVWPEMKKEMTSEEQSNIWPNLPTTTGLFDPGMIEINVSIQTPNRHATINISASIGDPLPDRRSEELRYFEVRHKGLVVVPDWHQTRSFGDASLREISAIFRASKTLETAKHR